VRSLDLLGDDQERPAHDRRPGHLPVARGLRHAELVAGVPQLEPRRQAHPPRRLPERDVVQRERDRRPGAALEQVRRLRRELDVRRPGQRVHRVARRGVGKVERDDGRPDDGGFGDPPQRRLGPPADLVVRRRPRRRPEPGFGVPPEQHEPILGLLPLPPVFAGEVGDQLIDLRIGRGRGGRGWRCRRDVRKPRGLGAKRRARRERDRQRGARGDAADGTG
jgi:hypothetical protein